MTEHAIAPASRRGAQLERGAAGAGQGHAPLTSDITANGAALVFCCERACLEPSRSALLQRLGADLVKALMRRFLDCAIEDLAAWPGHPIVVAPEEDSDWARALRAPVIWMQVQSFGHFGNRIRQVDREILDRGIRHRIYLRAAVPSLSRSDYDAALAGLDSHDVVVGPVVGGGVGLLALRHPWPQIATLPWSSTTIGGRLRMACLRRGWTMGELRPHYALQHADDLSLIQATLTGDDRTARAELRRFIGTLLRETT